MTTKAWGYLSYIPFVGLIAFPIYTSKEGDTMEKIGTTMVSGICQGIGIPLILWAFGLTPNNCFGFC